MTASPKPLSIIQFTPFPWDGERVVNRFVDRISTELAGAGHSVVIAAPGGGRGGVAATQSELDRLGSDPDALFAPGEAPRMLSMGAGVGLPRGSRRRQAPVSVDVGNRVETLLGSGAFDIVHVHDPFLPGFSSTALRHSFSLNVGTFHETGERPFATLVARPLMEIFFGRLDGRTASSEASAELLNRYFPGAYELTRSGVDPVEPDQSSSGPLRIAFSEAEEPGALRLFLRALRRLPEGLDWTATIHARNPGEVSFRVAREIRSRIKVVGPKQVSLAELCAVSDVFVAASGGPAPVPGALRQAIASGAVPVASTIGRYTELVGDGKYGLLFPAGDPVTLAGQIARLDDGELRSSFRKRGLGAGLETWADLAGRFEQLYRGLTDRRHSRPENQRLRTRLAKRPLIDIDLHMHTDHSSDCATPVEVLIETARDRGFGAIAITDHNEVSGALAAAEVAAGIDDFQIIVGEEVKTAEQGEVIGLFLKEKIPRGMTMAETVAEIRRQGGLVYVPHPFDRLHSVPDYEHLLDMVEEIDLMEVFNPRVAISSFNEEAERFARKYNIVPAAGSDSHVAQGLGAVRVRVPRFEGPEEFLEAMRDAEITRRHKNLVYVQALKFIQTTGRPKAAKRTVADPKAVRGGRRKARGQKRAGGKS
ncbi:MAG: glycosyltransferase [Solirubrobacterales bacterium]|nr:glycosyltransferase [Solirubrobacterales bacterium]